MSIQSDCNIQVFIFPITYQTVSFHHQANYEIKIKPIEQSCFIHSIFPIQQMFTQQKKQQIDRNGNIINVGGKVVRSKMFKTNKFQIEYNDQIIKFKTGFIARLKLKGQMRLTLSLQLFKYMINQKQAKNSYFSGGKKVSSQLLQIKLNLQQSDFNIRRIIFPTNQYISFVDISYQLAQTSCLREKMVSGDIRILYKEQVVDRLKYYKNMCMKLQRKIKLFEQFKQISYNFKLLNISYNFIDQFVNRQIPYLNHVAIQTDMIPEQLQSNYQLQKQQNIQLGDEEHFIALLSRHYQSSQSQISNYIKAQGRLIQINIRALFSRLVQLTIIMHSEDCLHIQQNEIRRIKKLIAISDQQSRSSKNILDINKYNVQYKNKIQNFLKKQASVTKTQLRQPYIEIKNYKINSQIKYQLAAENTLTIFIHGFKGNQYDLSKIKSHLNILLGFTHFYSIKGLSADKSAELTIHQLGQTAAEELLNYLSINRGFRYINIIGFSLGGLIGRAMLPWLEEHKAKFNLFITIATPHLGIRQVNNCLVRTGLCYMRRIAGIQAIRQLNIERNDKQFRYLLELADGNHLQWFKSIILVGSYSDQYVPVYSSLVEYKGDDAITLEMYKKLGEKLSRAIRCSVNLEYNQSLLDMITLRRTHISFLEEDSFIRYLIIKFQSLFLHPS